jgi:hypothetical protein
MSFFWLFLTVVIFVKSPMGRALADRLAGRAPEGATLSNEDLEFLHQIEDRMMDLEERLEYTERRIQQQQERDRLRAGS